MEIIDNLEKLGIKKRQAKAYFALLKLQKASPHQIAKEAGVERTTIYNIMEDLSSQGLATKIIQGKRLEYAAEPPVKLKEILQRQENILSETLPLLTSLQGSKGIETKVKFYNSLEEIRKALNDSLNCQEKLRRDFAFIENVVDLFGLRFLHNHIEERAKKKIKVRSLRRALTKKTDSEKDWYLKKENKDLLRETRYLDPLIEFEPLIIIYDHIVSIFSSKKESFALVIESPEFSQAMKTLFDIAWQTAKK